MSEEKCDSHANTDELGNSTVIDCNHQANSGDENKHEIINELKELGVTVKPKKDCSQNNGSEKEKWWQLKSGRNSKERK